MTIARIGRSLLSRVVSPYAVNVRSSLFHFRGLATTQTVSSQWCTPFEESQAQLLDAVKSKVDLYNQSLPIYHDDDFQAQIEKSKAAKELAPLAEAWKSYQDLRKTVIELKQHLEDEDPMLREMFASEHEDVSGELDETLRNKLPHLLLPPSETATFPAIMSLNAGVGGGEAARFAEQLSRLYIRFAEGRGWKVQIMSKTEGPTVKGGDGLREATIKFEPPPGSDDVEVYGLLQWERGVHRVQRVPITDSTGRIHTSTVAVVVLPVYPEETEAEPLVDPKDVKVEVMRSRGAGGQHVNTTESAVRLTHIPTGISVSMQDSRSQHQNRAWAWEVLRARLAERKHAEEVEARRASRRSQVRTASRSDKIRTYNEPQSRVTDHRIGLSLSGYESFMDGDELEGLIEELKRDLFSQRLTAILEGEEDDPEPYA